MSSLSNFFLKHSKVYRNVQLSELCPAANRSVRVTKQLWGVITAKIHTPYSIIRGGGGGGVSVKWGGGVREVGGGGGCYAMLQIVARQVQVPFHTNPNHMPYRWKPSPHRVMAAAAIYWLGVSESNNIASAKFRGRLIQMDR